MNAMVFALVDAVLVGNMNWHRQRRATGRNTASHFWRFIQIIRMKQATENVRAATQALGWWRSLWGVL